MGYFEQFHLGHRQSVIVSATFGFLFIDMAKQIFFVTALTKAENVKAKLEAAIPEAELRFQLAPDRWMVYAEGPAGKLADQFGIRGDPFVGNGLVLALGSYAGRAPSALWEWIKARTE